MTTSPDSGDDADAPADRSLVPGVTTAGLAMLGGFPALLGQVDPLALPALPALLALPALPALPALLALLAPLAPLALLAPLQAAMRRNHSSGPAQEDGNHHCARLLPCSGQ